MERLLYIATFAAALGAGLVAGIFFAFSTFVMGALGRLPQAAGISAMQSINVVVINPVFLSVFMGTRRWVSARRDAMRIKPVAKCNQLRRTP